MAGNPEWKFSVERGRPGFEKLRVRWQTLVDGWPQASFIQQPGWIGSHLDGLQDGGSHVRFIVAERGEHLGGVLALEYRRGGLHALVPQLTLVSSEHLVQTDLVANPADIDLWPALLDWLGRQGELRCLVLRLPIVGADTVLGQCLARDQRQSTQRVARSHAAWLDCSQGAAHALRNISRGFRQNLNRLGRRAEKSGKLEYDSATTPAALGAALTDFLAVEASGWKKDTGTAILLDPARVRFYCGLVREFGPRGNCRINVLRLDGQAIAVQFGLVSDRTLHLLKIGYSAEHSALAPGNLLMRETLSQVCADPALDRLSLVTHPAWAHHWKPCLTPVDHVTVFTDTPLGRVLCSALRWRRQQARAQSAPITPAEVNRWPASEFAADGLSRPIALADPASDARGSVLASP